LLLILLSILLSCTIVIVIVILLVSPSRSWGLSLSVVILCSWGRVVIVSILFIVSRGCSYCCWIFIIICLIISISIILIVIMIIISISIISRRCSISLLLCCTLLILSHSFTDHSFIDLLLSLDSFDSFINIISHLRVFLLFFF
jgi:hypothetical protein